MNILFLYRIFPSYGGVEVVTSVLANEFVKDGHNVTIASFERGKEGVLQMLDNKVKLLFLKRKIFSRSNIATFQKYCRENKIEVVINQWGLPFYTSFFVKISVPEIRLISVLHGSPTVAKTLLHTEGLLNSSTGIFLRAWYKGILCFKKNVIRVGLRYSVKVNEKFVLLSKGFIPPFEEFTGLTSEKVIAIGNPITIPTDYSIHKEEKRNIILYVGRMDYENKRVDRIVNFWERNNGSLPDWELIMIGDGPYKKDVEKNIAGLQRVHLYPFQVEPPIEFYKRASLLLLTSDLEGFGLVVIEAMSYGVVPVVYGSYEAIYDIINSGKDGIITSCPFNEKEYDDAVMNYCKDSILREKASLAAVEKSRHFSVDDIKKKWYGLLIK